MSTLEKIEFLEKKKSEGQCYHCGDLLPNNPILNQGKKFCCEGCNTVFTLINQEGLCDFYDLKNQEKLVLNKLEESDNSYDVWDTEFYKSKITKFEDGNVSIVELFVPVIHCSACIYLLENITKFNKGILRSEVNFSAKKVTINYRNDQVKLSEIVRLITMIGYKPAQPEEDTQKRLRRSDRQLIIKLGVAGFAFGNIMLLSFPEYLAGSEWMFYEEYARFFGYLNFLIALPVLLYSSTDFFKSAIGGLRARFVNLDVPISIGIVALFFRSTLDIFMHTGAGFMDSFAGLIFFLLLGRWYQGKTYSALSFDRAYKSFFPISVVVEKDGKELNTPINDLKQGDIIFLRNNELIPADSILMDGEVSIDYSFVTGESVPVVKVKSDKVYAGGKIVGKAARFIIEKPVSQSHLTSLWNSVKTEEKNQRAILANMSDKVSKNFTYVILIIASLTGIYWGINAPDKVWHVVTSVLIIACPCALALSVPFTYGSALRELGKQGFYLKDGNGVEYFADTNTLVFDKTGTLTDTQKPDIQYQGEGLTEIEKNSLASALRQSVHPLSHSLYQLMSKAQIELIEVNAFQEVPSKGFFALVGDLEIRVGTAQWVGTQKNDALSTGFYLKIGNKFGHFAFANQYRAGVKDLIEKLKSKYDLYLLSGDNEAEKNVLSQIFPDENKLHFNLKPADKQKFVMELKKTGKNVCMVGDGVNDSGALSASDFGISVADDIYQFTPASDAILNSGALGKLAELKAFAEKSVKTVKLAYIISFMYNFVGLSFAVQGLVSPLFAAILMPLSSISVVIFTTGRTYWLSSKTF